MKKVIITGAAATALTLVVMGGPIISHAATSTQESMIQTTDQNQKVAIPDNNLKKALNQKLGQPETADITSQQMSTIIDLNVYNQNISSLEGLQYCINLEKLVIGTRDLGGVVTDNSNTVSDLSPLKNLHKLKVLQAGLTNIFDFSPLKNIGLVFSDSFINTSSYLGGQHIYQDVTAKSDGALTIKNPCVNIDGSVMKPYGEYLSGGVYDEATNTITWKNVRTGHYSVGGKVLLSDLCFSNSNYRHGQVWMNLTVTIPDAPKGQLGHTTLTDGCGNVVLAMTYDGDKHLNIHEGGSAYSWHLNYMNTILAIGSNGAPLTYKYMPRWSYSGWSDHNATLDEGSLVHIHDQSYRCWKKGGTVGLTIPNNYSNWFMLKGNDLITLPDSENGAIIETLFDDATGMSVLKPNVTQQTINDVKQKVQTYKNETLKSTLNHMIERAQKQLK